jgi:enoyl-[acyl-carrier protein] reductase II
LRALRTERTTRLEKSPDVNAMAEFGKARDLYFGGDMEAAIPLTGQVAGRIDAVRPVGEIMAEIREEFRNVVRGLARQYPG